MKTIYITIWITVMTLLLVASCAPSEDSNEALGAIPSAEKIDATVTVDQATNTVHFVLNNAIGHYPIWIFTNEKGESTVVTENNYKKVYSKKGHYTVEVKMGNRNGMSQGSITKSFQIDRTLMDEKLVKALCGSLDGRKEWVWNSQVNGHFGCGPSGSPDGLGWWPCGANEKAGVGLYDGVFTFGADNSYQYNPGNSGTVYVNAGCTKFPEYVAGGADDYRAAAALQTSTWEFSNEGATVYILFPRATLVGYVPGDMLYENPKFRIVSLSEDKLVMVTDDGSISWRYEFIPKK